MKAGKILSATALALLISNVGVTNVASAQELDALTNETCSVDVISEFVKQGENAINALLKSIELMPECTKAFVEHAVSNDTSAVIDIVFAAINAKPEQIVDIVVAAVQVLPDQRDIILGSVLDTVDDLSTRIDIIYAAYGLDRTVEPSDEEVIAELEEVDGEVDDVAELEEAAAPTAPPPPAFNPGANDKPAGISPT